MYQTFNIAINERDKPKVTPKMKTLNFRCSSKKPAGQTAGEAEGKMLGWGEAAIGVDGEAVAEADDEGQTLGAGVCEGEAEAEGHMLGWGEAAIGVDGEAEALAEGLAEAVAEGDEVRSGWPKR